jgi:hypothetical protein
VDTKGGLKRSVEEKILAFSEIQTPDSQTRGVVVIPTTPSPFPYQILTFKKGTHFFNTYRIISCSKTNFWGLLFRKCCIRVLVYNAASLGNRFPTFRDTIKLKGENEKEKFLLGRFDFSR